MLVIRRPPPVSAVTQTEATSARTRELVPDLERSAGWPTGGGTGTCRPPCGPTRMRSCRHLVLAFAAAVPQVAGQCRDPNDAAGMWPARVIVSEGSISARTCVDRPPGCWEPGASTLTPVAGAPASN